jgi:hypothetical protein
MSEQPVAETAARKPAIEGKRFMVWCEDGGLPTVAHRSWGVALAEAKRLAKLHRGFRFHVMQTSIVVVKAVKPPVEAQPELVEF